MNIGIGKPRKRPAKKILMLIDWDNLSLNMDLPPSESRVEGFNQLIKQITQEVGEIAIVVVFLPPNLAHLVAEDMYGLGFFIMICPKIKDKKGVRQDMTDRTIIDFGKKMIALIPDLTHLCLGSGDKDFIPLIREATLKGLKIMIVAGNRKSLSQELVGLADEKDDGQKLIYLFSPQSQEEFVL